MPLGGTEGWDRGECQRSRTLQRGAARHSDRRAGPRRIGEQTARTRVWGAVGSHGISSSGSGGSNRPGHARRAAHDEDPEEQKCTPNHVAGELPLGIVVASIRASGVVLVSHRLSGTLLSYTGESHRQWEHMSPRRGGASPIIGGIEGDLSAPT